MTGNQSAGGDSTVPRRSGPERGHETMLLSVTI